MTKVNIVKKRVKMPIKR